MFYLTRKAPGHRKLNNVHFLLQGPDNPVCTDSAKLPVLHYPPDTWNGLHHTFHHGDSGIAAPSFFPTVLRQTVFLQP